MKKYTFTGNGFDHYENRYYREEFFAECTPCGEQSGRRFGWEEFPRTLYGIKQGELIPPCASTAQECCEVGIDLIRLGKVDAGCLQFARAMEFEPQNPIAHSFYIIGLDYMGAPINERITELKRWGARHCMPPQLKRVHGNIPNATRIIKVGYVSGDFHRHSAFYTIFPLIRAHNRELFHVTCYYTGFQKDDYTNRMKANCDEWRHVYNWRDSDLLELIVADRIDILVDLSGHTSGHKLHVFAQQPAPIQFPAFGFVEGNGLSTTTHVFGDQMLVTEYERKAIGKPVYDLPSAFFYEMPPEMPSVSELPSAWGEVFTFGCFNKLDKINDDVLRLWWRVLQAVPHSRLLLKDQWYNDFALRRALASRMTDIGYDLRRVQLLGESSHVQHMECFDEVDIALDPFPHGGGTSSAEALHMGVPVITKYGHTPPGRATTAMLLRANLGVLVAQNDDEYVEIAQALAHPMARKAMVLMRANLRERMQQSPLCNAPLVVNAIETAYIDAFTKWCNKQRMKS